MQKKRAVSIKTMVYQKELEKKLAFHGTKAIICYLIQKIEKGMSLPDKNFVKKSKNYVKELEKYKKKIVYKNPKGAGEVLWLF